MEPTVPSGKSHRLDSVDMLRGIVMVIMALDHVRDFFTNVRFYPLDLTQTWPALYMTRWITHFCAPTFVFLAGTGAFLAGTRGKSKPELAKFLLTRGIWLIIVEHTIVRFGWVFNFDYSFMVGQVIWAIGWSMVCLAGLVFLPVGVITAVGIAIVALHNALDGLQPEQFGNFAWLWMILHEGGFVEITSGMGMEAAYPLIPWIGVMAAGYGFGAIMQLEEKQRRKTLLRLGLGLALGFIVLRWLNVYGDPNLWTSQRDLLFTIFSFIDTVKYPPSLLYLMMTLGPAIASLALLERVKGRVAEFFIVFGRVPFFYYVLHLPLIHGLAYIAAMITDHDPSFMTANVPPWEWPGEYGFDLPVVYLVWVAVILMLYPACRWYAGLKRRNKSPLLSYL
ncbi:MAG: DUF1624 domain-containing protein [Bacteroidota bacterium]